MKLSTQRHLNDLVVFAWWFLVALAVCLGAALVLHEIYS